MRVSSGLVAVTQSLLLVAVGLYLLSLSTLFFLDSGLAHFRSINRSVQTFLLGPTATFMICARVSIWIINKDPISAGKTILTLVLMTLVGIAAYFYIVVYIPWVLMVTTYRTTPLGIETSRSLGFGLTILALRTIPFACGVIMIWKGAGSLFRTLLR